MRKSHEMTIDRGLLLFILHLAEPYGLLNDDKLQQLCFLCELQMFGKGLKGFHFEFFRFAYGAFSKDLDNDLTSLRRKERVENFTLSDQARDEVLRGAVGRWQRWASVVTPNSPHLRLMLLAAGLVLLWLSMLLLGSGAVDHGILAELYAGRRPALADTTR